MSGSTSPPVGESIVAEQRRRQAAWFERTFSADQVGYGGSAYRLQPEHRCLNLAPAIRMIAQAYFDQKGITWHRHANHGLSSQVCCLNFLMPLATKPDLLSPVIGEALGIPAPEMLPVEDGPDGRPWFVGFEWIGKADYLNEAGKAGGRTRGANATSADAVVRFLNDGRIETVLIEWKYTESYGAPIPSAGNETRTSRYKGLAFAPSGPLRANLGLKLDDFYWEPFYQLLRQQMLAWRMQHAHEDGSERVRVLHISPGANRALRKVTSPALRHFGDDALAVFPSLLSRPDSFIGRSTFEVFGRALETTQDGQEWSSYLRERYASVLV